MSKRKVLIAVLEDNLLPFLIQKGFKRIPARDKKEKWYFPLGKLQRKRGAVLEWIEVQFQKYGRAEFIVNLKVSRRGKFEICRCRLHDSALKNIEKWFSMFWFAWPLNDVARASRTARRVELAFSEIEDWFATRKSGPHLRYTLLENGSWTEIR